MKWIANHQYLGSEFDFLASDSSGKIAYFSSAGFGPIPREVAELGARMYDLCEGVDSLPRVSQAAEMSQKPNMGEWVAIAERGFYAYDWSHEDECYELVAQPYAPIRASDLTASSSDLQAFVQNCLFDGDFSDSLVINTRDT
jgi:hypothetical protein